MRMGKARGGPLGQACEQACEQAQACEQKPRQCFASGNHDPVDKVAIQEGNLLMRLLAAAVDRRGQLAEARACHPEEQPLDMRTGLAEASKDEALVGKGVQVSLQGAALRCRCPVVGNINGVELGLGDPTECLGPSLNGLGACRPFAVPDYRWPEWMHFSRSRTVGDYIEESSC